MVSLATDKTSEMIREAPVGGRSCSGFTLQWHLTNRCQFNCRHCYDRSIREELSLTQSYGVLRDLQAFCQQRGARPGVCFTGGDPLLYPHFWKLYEAAANEGMVTSILGNPTSPETIGHLMEIQPPMYYQVSLEGLAPHNDVMRGEGHFEQVMAFLLDARRMRLRTSVMLTLTHENIDQVIPLGQELRGLTSRYTFNRLSQVGQAGNMASAEKIAYVEFLKSYVAAGRTNPVLGFKDNLFNIIRHYFGLSLLGGCTGYGCGAATNFVALLPDGQIHACRKYPSPLGNILETSLLDIYVSDIAKAYRDGPDGCRDCGIRQACGGCQAVTFGQGLDPLKDRDPYCFINEREEHLKIMGSPRCQEPL